MDSSLSSLSSRWSKEEIAAGIRSHTQSRFAITTQKFPISKADAIAALEARLAIPVPEMIFGDNLLEVAHPSARWALRFSARDALDAVDKTDRNMLRVAHARDWESSREETTQKIKEVVKPYDWTYSTTFRGAATAARRPAEAPRTAMEPATATTTATDTTATADPRNTADTITRAPSAGAAATPAFAPTETRIPMEVLRRRDPILFFDEVVLYESELDDNGVSVYSVKIRVHEHCLFVLARLFMRLDGVLIRIRDTRVFVDLVTDEIIREYTAKEATHREVVEALSRSGMAVVGDFVKAVRDPNTLEPHLRTVEHHVEAVSLSS